ncbi:MAG: hypothetical protein ACRDJH_09100 [Thermomicrobiales bacterium]
MAKHRVAYDELLAFATGTAPDARRDEIARHVQGCAACAATVATYQRVRESVRWDAVEAPSATTITRLKRIMAPAVTAATTAPTLLGSIRRIVARLVFDGRQPAAAAGLRGAADGYALVYAAADVDVDLHVEPSAAGRELWLITGQISLPADEVAVAVVLSAAEPPSEARVNVDDTGMFSLTAGAGAYNLLIRMADEEILLPDVSVG